MKHYFWYLGSFNYVYAFTTSNSLINNSNLYDNPFLLLWYFANGVIIWGWSITNVGLLQSGSINFPTNLSINFAEVKGGLTYTLFFAHIYFKKLFHY